MSLYQKYRPSTFSSIVGQDFVKQTLANACLLDRVHHGYIFFGSHGIGKTTFARVMAKTINCTNIQKNGDSCEQCETCKMFNEGKLIDVIEIDAASNTGVDNIRELIDQARFAPTYAKKKVYIIDEVHMLSKGAFNALLKILEEPPEHVIFILATTEVQKVPDTILSRTIRFDLVKFTQAQLIDRLKFIASEEGISTDEQALEVIVRAAKGGMRDAISLFEQFSTNGDVTYDAVKEQLRLADMSFLEDLFIALTSGDIDMVRENIGLLLQKGGDPKFFLEEWLSYLHGQSVNAIGTDGLVTCTKIYTYFETAYSRLRSSPDGWSLVELSFLELVHKFHKGELQVFSYGKEASGVRRQGDKSEDLQHVGANNDSPNSDKNAEESSDTNNDSPNMNEKNVAEENKAPVETNDSKDQATDDRPQSSKKVAEKNSLKPENGSLKTEFSKDTFLTTLKASGVFPTGVIAALRGAQLTPRGDHLVIEASAFHLKKLTSTEVQASLSEAVEVQFGLIAEYHELAPVEADEASEMFS